MKTKKNKTKATTQQKRKWSSTWCPLFAQTGQVKFFAPRVTPPAQHRKVPVEALKKNSFKKYQNYKPHGTQIVTRNLQNGPQKPPKWRPKPSKIEPKLGQEGARTTSKLKNNKDPTKRGAASHRVPPLWRKMWPTWPQVGFQNRLKIC